MALTPIEVTRPSERDSQQDRPKGIPTFEQWAIHWFDNHETMRATTRRIYRLTIDKHILPTIGHLPLDVIDAGDMTEVIDVASERAYSAAWRTYVILRAILHGAVRAGHIQTNPMAHVARPKAGNR